MSVQREIKAASLLLTISILLSRILGFARDAFMASWLGASGDTDAYFAAFIIPDFINYFLAGSALTSALLPIYTARIIAGQRSDGWALVTSVMRLSFLVILVASAITFVAADPLIRLWYSGFDDAQVALTVRLTRIVLPGPIFFMLGQILNSTEQARKRFLATALMPLVYNAFIILGGWLGHSSIGIEGFSWGVIVGAFAGSFLVPLLLTWDISEFRRTLPLNDPDVLLFFRKALPLIFSTSLIFFDEWLGRRFASGLEDGAITWLNNARRLMLVPAMLVGQAIGQAAFPILTRLRQEAKPGDEGQVAQVLDDLFQSTMFLSTVGLIGLYLISSEGTALVYHRGAYTAEDAAATASLVAVLAFAIPGWAIYTITQRVLYAASQTLTPALIGIATLVPSFFVYRWMAAHYGTLGIAISTGACITLSCLVLLAEAQRMWNHGPWRALGTGGLIGLVVGGSGFALVRFVTPTLESLPLLLHLVVAGVIFAAPGALLMLKVKKLRGF